MSELTVAERKTSMNTVCKTVCGFALAMSLAILTVMAPAPAEAQWGVQSGILTCKKIPGSGINLLFHSVADMECEFLSPRGKEMYKGEAGILFGVDLEWSVRKVITYAVFGGASDVRVGRHALAGTYIGGKASASVGVGWGAQVLVGGGEKNITLQPLALESTSGIGASAGVGYLSLKPA